MELNIIKICLASKTGRRAAITVYKYYEHGLSPLFFVCGTSTLTSEGAAILLCGSKALYLSLFDYLIDLFIVILTTLGVCSDFIDRNLKWYSPVL